MHPLTRRASLAALTTLSLLARPAPPARAQPRPDAATAAATRTAPSREDLVRAEVALVDTLRRCLPADGWHLAAQLALDPRTGRATVTPAEGAAFTPAEQRCVARAAARVRVARFAAGEPFRAALALDGRDPRGRLLAAVDPGACVPAFDPCRCQINAAVTMNARRPGVVASVSFTVQGCVVLPLQMNCLEQAVARLAWPANPRDEGSFNGVVGPTCGG